MHKTNCRGAASEVKENLLRRTKYFRRLRKTSFQGKLYESVYLLFRYAALNPGAGRLRTRIARGRRLRDTSAPDRPYPGVPHDAAAGRTRAVSRLPFGAHLCRRLARTPHRRAWPERLEGPVLAGSGGRLRDDRLRLRRGAAGAGGALFGTGLDPPSGRAADAAGLRAAGSGLRAGHAHQARGRPSDGAGGQDLGTGAPDRQRHAGRRAAVRQLPCMGRARLHGRAPPRPCRRHRPCGWSGVA